MKPFSRTQLLLSTFAAGALMLGVACKSDSGAKRDETPPPPSGTSSPSGTDSSTPPTSAPPDSDTGGSGIPTPPPEDPLGSTPPEQDPNEAPGTGGSGTLDPAEKAPPRDDAVVPMPDPSNREDPYAPDANEPRERPDGQP